MADGYQLHYEPVYLQRVSDGGETARNHVTPLLMRQDFSFGVVLSNGWQSKRINTIKMCPLWSKKKSDPADKIRPPKTPKGTNSANPPS